MGLIAWLARAHHEMYNLFREEANDPLDGKEEIVPYGIDREINLDETARSIVKIEFITVRTAESDVVKVKRLHRNRLRNRARLIFQCVISNSHY